ncbi:MAG: hypothetical protein HY247_02910 [archaeon]|nr:MAG: hypothetical protein HY247_02910 [archaeon]
MGKVVHLSKVKDFIRMTPVFRVRDVEIIVGDKGYASLLLHNLACKGEVSRVARGWYSARTDPTFAVMAFMPAYLGLEEALSLHRLWDQATNPVIVTPSRVRPGLRESMGGRIVVHRIEERYFFGYDYLEYEGAALPVSDIEKTLIDLVYFGVSPGREFVRSALKQSDREKLRKYLQKYEVPTRKKLASGGLLGP